MVQYILKGLSHYIYLLFNMLDFKDNGFILKANTILYWLYLQYAYLCKIY